jgi:thiamine-phosphate pyrophosphorylase
VPQLKSPLLLITDGKTYPEQRLEQALSAVPGGSIAVQLRNRALEGAALLRIALRLRSITSLFSAPLFVNDRLDVALAAGADGVHLPGHGLQPRAVRALSGDRLIISAAAHSLAQAQKLAQSGADCLTFGPIWPTPSKPDEPSIPVADRVSPVGTEALAAVTAALPIPIYALGGIATPERAAACAVVGSRVACLRAVLGDDDAAAAAMAFLDAVTQPA